MTDFFAPPGHFYSPWPDPAEAEAALANAGRPIVSIAGVAIDDFLICRTWEQLVPSMRAAPMTETKADGRRYQYLNGFYSFGDALVYFAFLATRRPKRVIEVGSGYSSALALDTRDYLELQTELTFIEPYPDVLRSLIQPERERGTILVERKVQDVPTDIFRSLVAGDILFIDSSHVVKTGSDVCHIIFEILPLLKSGVLVHFHDVFYPFEYPAYWVLDERRSWNELYALRAFLMYNSEFQVHFFNHYFFLRHGDLVARSETQFARNCGGGLWLMRK